MSFQFKLPDIGEGVHEGEVVKWLVKEGDSVKEDQDIVEVMTDKATVQISSPRTGRIKKIHFADGAVVKVGQVLVEIQEADARTGRSAETAEPPAASHVRNPLAATGGHDPKPPETVRKNAPQASRAIDRATDHAPGPRRTPFGILAPPSVRIAARKAGVDLAQLKGSGPAGQIGLADLERTGPPSPSRAPSPAHAPAPARSPEVAPVSRDKATRVERVHFPADSPSAHAGRAKRLQAHFSYVLSLDAGKLAAAGKRTNLPTGAFVTRAIALALANHKRCNALVDEATNDLIIAREVNVGVARRQGDQLRIAVVRDAPKRSVADIAKAVAAGGDKGATGTITVVSLGQHGPIAGTPVLVHPQVAVCMVGPLREVAVLRNGQAVVGHELNLSFSFDHRYVDGHEGAQFANEVAKRLEEADRL